MNARQFPLRLEHMTESAFQYQPRQETCHLCKGTKMSRPSMTLVVHIPPSGGDITVDAGELCDDTCPACMGSGSISLPPFNDGSKAKIARDKVSELAKAGTLLRCIGEPMFVAAVANQAAHITLPDEMVLTYVAYWSDSARDVNLGQYIQQIAQSAEELAMQVFGGLDNHGLAGPRSHLHTNPEITH